MVKLGSTLSAWPSTLKGLATLGRNFCHFYKGQLLCLSVCFPALKFPYLFVCVEVLRPSQPNGVMLSAVSLPNHTFTGQA